MCTGTLQKSRNARRHRVSHLLTSRTHHARIHALPRSPRANVHTSACVAWYCSAIGCFSARTQSDPVLGPMSAMLKIGPRSRTEKELTNHIEQFDHMINAIGQFFLHS